MTKVLKLDSSVPHECSASDSDSLSSACGERCHGSMSSKLRLRIKMDSNLDVKIEKMELDSELFGLGTMLTPMIQISDKKEQHLNQARPVMRVKDHDSICGIRHTTQHTNHQVPRHQRIL